MLTPREILGLPTGRLQLLTVELLDKLNALEGAAHEPVAIIGMASRYPGPGGGLEGFWQTLERREIVEPGVRDNDPGAVPFTVLRDAADFDPGFFGFAERDAVYLDPQQRLILEVAWEALEDAGRPPEQMPSRTGVFLGLCSHDYAGLLAECIPEASGWLVMGNSHGITAGRLARLFGFHGPALALDVACASSMLAAHAAVRALRDRSCDAALVGGASVMATARIGRDLADAGLLSARRACRPFDARGEGCGVLIFKRLSEALPQAHALALATNSIETFVKPAHLRPGAIVCDTSRPFNVDPEVTATRPDVELIEGGLVQLPPGSQPSLYAGPRPGLVYACAAETMLWALEQAYDRVSPDGCMEVESLLELEAIAARQGFVVDTPA